MVQVRGIRKLTRAHAHTSAPLNFVPFRLLSKFYCCEFNSSVHGNKVVASNSLFLHIQHDSNKSLFFHLILTLMTLHRKHGHVCIPGMFFKVCFLSIVGGCASLCSHLSARDKSNHYRLNRSVCTRILPRLYGPQACTINMHLHCHLADCLRDYGPVHAS